MARRLDLAVAALVLAVLTTVTPSIVHAEPGGTTLQVSGPVGATVGDTVELVATLTDDAGAPVADVQLLVDERLGFFDTKASDVTVASAATNDDGVAVIRYVARREAARSLVIRFPGNNDFAEASAGLQFTVVPGQATYAVEAPPGIPGVNELVLMVVLVAVWGTMLVVAAHVVAIARAGDSADLEDGEAVG
jgi:hypothetical protein